MRPGVAAEPPGSARSPPATSGAAEACARGLSPRPAGEGRAPIRAGRQSPSRQRRRGRRPITLGMMAPHPPSTAPRNGTVILGYFLVDGARQFQAVQWSVAAAAWLSLSGEALPEVAALVSWGPY